VSERHAGETQAAQQDIALRRALSLPLLTLYGLGVTVGAGIYVLVGATAAKAGFYAPVSFLVAACVVAFTGLSYAEMGTRYPVSAGEAAYVRGGFNSSKLAALVGLMVAASGIVSSAAISIGASAYLQLFLPLPSYVLVIAIILSIGLIAVWGIFESVAFAGLFTLLEISGLGFVIFYGLTSHPDMVWDVTKLMPPLELAAWSGIFSAGLLAFFAFVGFEDIANVAEEVKDPGKTMPRAVILTLVAATLIYVAVVSVVVLSVPLDRLAGSEAPLALVFEGAGVNVAWSFNLVATAATVNGVLIQVIMASRVLYGLACQGSLPVFLKHVNPVTRTPLAATAVVVGIILVLALFLPISDLAEMTSLIVLAVFAMVNLALLRLKSVQKETPPGLFIVPVWVPMMGLLTCAGLVASALL